MSLSLGLDVAGQASAGRKGAAAAPPPPVFADITIEGDSITSTTPYQSTLHGDFYSTLFMDNHPGLAIRVPAQASRTVGGAAMNGELADTGSPQGNTLLLWRPEDMSHAPDLLTAMIGANDLTTFSVPTYVQRLIDWATPIRAAGTRIAYGVPTPRQNGQATYATYMPRWHALFDTLAIRNPSVWGQWADYYIPMGEHPRFLDSADWSSDGVHPSGPATGATTGQYCLRQVYEAAMATLLDTSRVNSTALYASAWPTDQTDLPPGTQVTVPFVLAGLAWAGCQVEIAVAGDGNPQVRRSAGAYAGALSERMYNGDVITLRLTTSASNAATAQVALTINGETRTIAFTTLAASPYAATFAATRKSPNAVLANGGKTFAGTDFGSTYPTRGATDVPLTTPTGYVEFTSAVTAHGYRNHLVGLADAAYSFAAGAQVLGQQAGSFAFNAQGVYYAGNGTAVNLAGSNWAANGAKVGVLVHKASGKVWLRTPGGWYPDTPSFAADGSLLGGSGLASGLTSFFFAAGESDESTLTVNAGQAAFAYALPANVEPGWA